MPVLDVVVNADPVSIVRPTDDGIGGDVNFKSVAVGLKGYVEESGDLDRDADSRTRTRRAVLLLQPLRPDGAQVDVEVNDHVIYADYRGVVQTREVQLVNPIYVLGQLDHFELELA